MLSSSLTPRLVTIFNAMFDFFTRKRKFINPLTHYWFHRHQIAEDFPVSLPPEEDETVFTTTLVLEAINYETEPMFTEKRGKIA